MPRPAPSPPQGIPGYSHYCSNWQGFGRSRGLSKRSGPVVDPRRSTSSSGLSPKTTCGRRPKPPCFGSGRGRVPRCFGRLCGRRRRPHRKARRAAGRGAAPFGSCCRSAFPHATAPWTRALTRDGDAEVAAQACRAYLEIAAEAEKPEVLGRLIGLLPQLDWLLSDEVEACISRHFADAPIDRRGLG